MFLPIFVASFSTFCIDFSPQFSSMHPVCRVRYFSSHLIFYLILHYVMIHSGCNVLAHSAFRWKWFRFGSYVINANKTMIHSDGKEFRVFVFLLLSGSSLEMMTSSKWYALCVCERVSASEFRMWNQSFIAFLFAGISKFRLHLMAQDDFAVQWWDSLIWKYFRIECDGSTITHTYWRWRDGWLPWWRRWHSIASVRLLCLLSVKCWEQTISSENFQNCGYCYGCLVLILLDLRDIRWSSKQTSAIVMRPNEKSTQNPNNAAIILWYALVRSQFYYYFVPQCCSCVCVCVCSSVFSLFRNVFASLVRFRRYIAHFFFALSFVLCFVYRSVDSSGLASNVGNSLKFETFNTHTHTHTDGGSDRAKERAIRLANEQV